MNSREEGKFLGTIFRVGGRISDTPTIDKYGYFAVLDFFNREGMSTKILVVADTRADR